MKFDLHDEPRSSTGGAWPPALIHATHGFMSSQVLFTLDEIGAFEQLRVGPLSITQLALATKCDPNALDRLVTAGVTLGLLERSAQREILIPSQLLPLLDPSSPRCITGIFEHFRRVSLRAFGVLTDAIRHGRSCFWEDHGGHVEGAFESMYSTAEGTSKFAGAMWALGYHAATELCEMFPPLGSRCLVDLGGGSGSFSIAALERWPELTAVVADLPSMKPVVEAAAVQRGLQQRLSFVACDFFRDPLPRADIYALGYVLSDWSYERGSSLLTRAYDALSPGGLVLVLERLFDEDRSGPATTALMDLAMLLETQGMHRTAREYVQWLQRFGFVDCQVYRSSQEKHAIIGFKPSRS